MRHMFFYETPVGKIGIAEENDAVTNLWFPKTNTLVDGDMWETPVLKKASKQLTGYFAGGRQPFTVPLAPAGTEFQLRVWAELRGIAHGQTMTYEEVARRVGAKVTARMVGAAVKANPILIFIPGHRVTGKNKKIAASAGGADWKRKLLELEMRGVK